MKVVVIGHKGMLGQDLMIRLEKARHEAIGLDIPDIDIAREGEAISCCRASKPDLIINCAAYTAVDKAEAEADLAFLVNREGVANLAKACKSQKIPLIHISTDYVFDGKSIHPYREDDPVNPLGVYGRSKWEGEQAVRSILDRHVIVRTAWLFGIHGHNFVKTILRLARENETIRVVADQFGCPTWTYDLADGLVRIAEHIADAGNKEPWGTYHFCGKGRTSWHGFAEAIVDEARQREQLKVRDVIPITTADYPTPAVRPAWSVLDCHKIEEAFGIVPSNWRDVLSAMMLELHSSEMKQHQY
ncbi:MAG: dTDP-4-dehydrorhamnose reductase [Desulforhabdus sp.]|jgi:dTDP-4-dehydrorhamnose reductase|nr:dTDP-4-dehydrorhamnose reductase [Desulforhabdus sp.]